MQRETSDMYDLPHTSRIWTPIDNTNPIYDEKIKDRKESAINKDFMTMNKVRFILEYLVRCFFMLHFHNFLIKLSSASSIGLSQLFPISRINLAVHPYLAKLIYLNFQPLESVYR